MTQEDFEKIYGELVNTYENELDNVGNHPEILKGYVQALIPIERVLRSLEVNYFSQK